MVVYNRKPPFGGSAKRKVFLICHEQSEARLWLGQAPWCGQEPGSSWLFILPSLVSGFQTHCLHLDGASGHSICIPRIQSQEGQNTTSFLLAKSALFRP